MKKYIIVIAVFALLFTACEKKETEGVSTETVFATFTMNGDPYSSIVVGETFTDPGATAKEGETDLEVAVKGTVDASKVGVYDIVYSAVNQDGFPGSVTRTVAVLPSAEQDGVDISGKYKNNGSFNYTAEMVKLAPGFYKVDNVWGGGSAAVIAAYVITADGSDLILPMNTLSGYGRVIGTGKLTGTNMVYTVSLLDQGLSDSERKWTKL